MEMGGVAVTAGYWQRDVLTGEPFTKDGRLRAGDVGHPDEGGFVHITGRIKHFISAFGEHVIGEEVEKAMKAAMQKFPEAELIEFTVAPEVTPREGLPHQTHP